MTGTAALENIEEQIELLVMRGTARTRKENVSLVAYSRALIVFLNEELTAQQEEPRVLTTTAELHELLPGAQVTDESTATNYLFDQASPDSIHRVFNPLFKGGYRTIEIDDMPLPLTLIKDGDIQNVFVS